MDGTVDRPRLVRPVIYGLFEPGTTFPCDMGNLRYIGKAVNLERRFKEHLASSRFRWDRKSRWIRSSSAGGGPKLMPMHRCSLGEVWQDIEKALIAHCLKSGAPLLNTAPGGEGGGRVKGQVLSLAHKSALRKAWIRRKERGLVRRGFMHSEESKAKMRAAKLGRPNLRLRGRPLSAQHRWKLSQAHLGKPAWNKGMDMKKAGYANVGNPGRVVSESTRRKSSLSHLGQVSWNKGKTLAAEHRAKIAASWIRRKEQWPSTCGKICCGG